MSNVNARPFARGWLLPTLVVVLSSGLSGGEATENAGSSQSLKNELQLAPYPPSTTITGIRWAAAETTVRKARGSDNWPITWADDDNLYTAYGDGNGFRPRTKRKLSMGFAKVSAGPRDFQGVNIRSPSGETYGDGPRGKKASGILMVESTLYLLARNANNSQLAWSSDQGKSWTWSAWKWEMSMGCPTFLNYGKNYSGARDNFIYVYSPDSDTAYDAADRMILARVPKTRLRDREAYEFFTGSQNGNPQWSFDIKRKSAVFKFSGNCYRGGITYNSSLQRYFWCQVLPKSQDSRGPRFEGGFGIYDAPEPWGPWTTVYFTRHWDMGPGETCSLPTKWMSADGRTMYLVFSGDDHFSVRKAEVEYRPSSR